LRWRLVTSPHCPLTRLNLLPRMWSDIDCALSWMGLAPGQRAPTGNSSPGGRSNRLFRRRTHFNLSGAPGRYLESAIPSIREQRHQALVDTIKRSKVNDVDSINSFGLVSITPLPNCDPSQVDEKRANRGCASTGAGQKSGFGKLRPAIHRYEPSRASSLNVGGNPFF
jgi:hypothetical protein